MVFLFFVYLLSGCSPFIRREQASLEDLYPLNDGKSIGQTFLAEFDGLNGYQVYLELVDPGEGEILMMISSPGSDEILEETAISIAYIAGEGYYNFVFNPLNNSQRQNYYVKLEVDGSGQVNVGLSSPNSYLNGSAYYNDNPQDKQMAFNLLYDPAWASIGIIKEVFLWIMILLVGIFIFVIPAWGFLSSIWHGWNTRTFTEKCLLSSGVSVAIYPVLLLWLNILGLQPGKWIALLPGIIGLGVILGRNWNSIKEQPHKFKPNITFSFNLPDIFLLFIVGFILVTRFWSVRLLEIPLWGDSYHHTMISQLIVDNGGLFSSWEPYAELNSFTYHFGFHTSAAIFHWVTGAQLSQSVLWVGQLLNIMAVLVLYPLAVQLGKNRWAGVIAVLIAGLLTPMPIFYTNWGRYTQLAGQVILPVVMYFLWDTTRQEKVSVPTIIVSSILLAGLALTHYRVLIFALFYLLVISLLQLSRRTIKPIIIKLLVIGLGSFTLFLPWFINVYGSTILRMFGEQITTSASMISQSTLEYNTIGNLTYYMQVGLWIFMGIAALIGLIIQTKPTVVVIIWSLLLLIAANPNWIGLPGAGVLSNFALFIAAYIPAALLIGITGGSIIEGRFSMDVDYSFIMVVGVSLIFLVFVVWGTQERLDDINPETYALVTQPDVKAIEWIKENTPAQSKFLINSFLAYDGTLAVGSDGGMWLPLLANRNTTLPPITYGFEQGLYSDYMKNTNQLIEAVRDLGPTNPEVIQSLEEDNVTHVYIGQRRGLVNYSGSETLDPNELSIDPHYQPVYHQDLVWIFRIVP